MPREVVVLSGHILGFWRAFGSEFGPGPALFGMLVTEGARAMHHREAEAWHCERSSGPARASEGNIGAALRSKHHVDGCEIRFSHHFETMVETIVCWYLQANHGQNPAPPKKPWNGECPVSYGWKI